MFSAAKTFARVDGVGALRNRKTADGGLGSDSVLLVNVQLDWSSLVSGPQWITLRCRRVAFRAHRQAPQPRRPQRHVGL